MILPPPRPVFFSYPKKQKKKPRKISNFCPRRFKTAREKILQTAREERIVPEEKKKEIFYPRKKKSLPEKKIRNQAVRNQKKSFKILNFCPRKNLKSIQDNFKMPEKIYAKVVEKNSFHPRKKPKKGQKIGFSGTFHFLG